ncbi:MAG: tryptophan synthase subunit alpha [Actinobacteria bacterium]|nr:tryptophan synthase subunit alpha [Actinomycetota bacterium]
MKNLDINEKLKGLEKADGPGNLVAVKNRITIKFRELKSKNRKALIPFITAGYPDLKSFMELFLLLERCGADIIEIGIPFSDPLADGPVIQKASKIALDNGTDTDTVLDLIKSFRMQSNIPVVVLSYFNILYRYGFERFFERAKECGIDGMIIPDLPLEEFPVCRSYFENSGIANIMLASLTSGIDRLAKIAESAKGFLYCVSVKGVTGVRKGMDEEVKKFLERLRGITGLPLAVGFGISNLSQIRQIKDCCDGVIIGSKLLSIIMESENHKTGFKEAANFLKYINRELKK